MALQGLSVFNLASGDGGRDPAPTWRWLCLMPTLPISKADGFLRQHFTPVYDISDKVLVEAVSEPFTSVQSTPRFAGSKNLYFPNFAEAESVSVTFKETYDYRVSRYIMTWQSLVVNPYGMYWGSKGYGGNNGGRSSGYAQKIVLRQYDIVNDRAARRVVHLHACWPASINSIDWNYEESNHVKLMVTFACDRISYTYPRV